MCYAIQKYIVLLGLATIDCDYNGYDCDYYCRIVQGNNGFSVHLHQALILIHMVPHKYMSHRAFAHGFYDTFTNAVRCKQHRE